MHYFYKRKEQQDINVPLEEAFLHSCAKTIATLVRRTSSKRGLSEPRVISV